MIFCGSFKKRELNKHMKKQILCLLLAGVLALCTVGCTTDTPSDNTDPTESLTVTDAQTEEKGTTELTDTSNTPDDPDTPDNPDDPDDPDTPDEPQKDHDLEISSGEVDMNIDHDSPAWWR